MKKRIISGLIGVVVLFAALYVFDTIIFVGIIGFVAAMAVYEMCHNTGYVNDKWLLSAACIFSFFIPFLFSTHLKSSAFVICFIYTCIMCAIFMFRHKTLMFNDFCVAFLISLLIPTVFAFLIIIRDKYQYMGQFYLLLCLGGAWLADVGAYFIGTFFGKHKLAPEISPNKTVEGFIGGIIFSTLFCILLGFIFTKVTPLLYPKANIALEVNYIALAVAGPICSVVGLFGDLFASMIKRQTGIKDYGKIMPGHGGVMDRFDSVIFVTPVIFIFINVFPLAQIINL